MYFSIIIPCKNEGENIKMTVDSILTSKSCVSREIIVIDDASEDNCCEFLKSPAYKRVNFYRTEGLGAANARNLGAELAQGEILVFCDAHIKVEDGWLDLLSRDFVQGKAEAISPAIAVLGDPDRTGYGQTWDANLENKWLTRRPSSTKHVPLLPGGCLAVDKKAFKEVDGFNRLFKVWGHEDEEISLKLWLFNKSCAVNPQIKIEHLFRPRHPYEVKMYHIHFNLLIMAICHFNFERIEKVKAKINHVPYRKQLLKEIQTCGAWQKREEFLKDRTYSDDWFMKKFKINF